MIVLYIDSAPLGGAEDGVRTTGELGPITIVDVPELIGGREERVVDALMLFRIVCSYADWGGGGCGAEEEVGALYS